MAKKTRKFCGSYEQLQSCVRRAGENGEWRDLGNQKQFRTDSGAILNWYESTHTVFMQGREPGKTNFEDVFWRCNQIAEQRSAVRRKNGEQKKPQPSSAFEKWLQLIIDTEKELQSKT